MAWDTLSTLPDEMLVKVDRASMAFGLRCGRPWSTTRWWRRPGRCRRRCGSAEEWASGPCASSWSATCPATCLTDPRRASIPPWACGCAGRCGTGPRTTSQSPVCGTRASSTRWRCEPAGTLTRPGGRPGIPPLGRPGLRGLARRNGRIELSHCKMAFRLTCANQAAAGQPVFECDPGLKRPT